MAQLLSGKEKGENCGLPDLEKTIKWMQLELTNNNHNPNVWISVEINYLDYTS